MEKHEYIKWYVKDFNSDYAPVLLYEVDLENDRYATRMVEIYEDRRIKKVEESGGKFITEAPVPEVYEINEDYPDFFAEIITKEEFEAVYRGDFYNGVIDFPTNRSLPR